MKKRYGHLMCIIKIFKKFCVFRKNEKALGIIAYSGCHFPVCYSTVYMKFGSLL